MAAILQTPHKMKEHPKKAQMQPPLVTAQNQTQSKDQLQSIRHFREELVKAGYQGSEYCG